MDVNVSVIIKATPSQVWSVFKQLSYWNDWYEVPMVDANWSSGGFLIYAAHDNIPGGTITLANYKEAETVTFTGPWADDVYSVRSNGDECVFSKSIRPKNGANFVGSGHSNECQKQQEYLNKFKNIVEENFPKQAFVSNVLNTPAQTSNAVQQPVYNTASLAMNNSRPASTNALGSQRLAAAILFLWTLLYSTINGLVDSQYFSVNAFGWLARLCSLGIIILLFIGRKNIGFPILIGLQTILSVRNVILYFSIYNIIWLVVDILMLIIAIYSTIPSIAVKKNPLKGLEFLPAGIRLVLNIYFFLGPNPFGLMFLINGIINSIATFLMANSLTSENDFVAVAEEAVTFTNSINRADQPAPFVPTPSTNQQSDPCILLLRFSIDSLNKLSGSYGFQSGNLIGKVIPASLLEGMTISDGDSAATLCGNEYVCIVSISALDSSVLKEKIEPLILASQEIREFGAVPITQIVRSTNEPLVVDGIVQKGKIEGPGGWCASGFMSAWKEQSSLDNKEKIII